MDWEPAERVQKNAAGEYRAFIGGAWVPVEKAQKNAAGQYRVMRGAPLDDGAPAASPPGQADSMRGVMTNSPAAQLGADLLHGATGTLRGAAALGPKSDDVPLEIPGANPNSGAALVGSLFDPLAWGIGVGGARVAPYAKVVGKGVVEGTKAVAKNLGIGAVTGGTIGGLVNYDDRAEGATSGASIGAALNQLLPPALRLVGTGVGKVLNAFNVKDRAANLLRDVVGADKDAMLAASASAPAGQTAAQSVSGIHNDLVPALESLARNKDIESYFSKLDVMQRNAILAELRAIAGGKTQTATRQTADASRKALNEATGEMRDTELSAANLAGQLLPRLEAQAERLGGAASNKVSDVRRLEAAKALAEQRAQQGGMTLGGTPPTVPGQPRVPGRYSYADELARRAEGASQQAADDSLILGAGARDAKMRADSLAQNGLLPLDTGGVIHRIDRLLNSPKTGVSDINRRVLTAVRDKIQEWTDRGKGVIDAEALYEIRKSSINDAVDLLLPTADPKAKAKRAAGLLTELKPAIDGAIEAAGGTGWRQYLEAYEQGARKITEQKMGAKALDLFERSPRRFESFAAGNEPKMVRQITGREYDVNEALGERGRDVVTRAATEVARNRGIKEAATRGEGGLAEVLKEHTASFRLPNFLNPKISVANRSLEVIENAVNDKTMAEVYKAMRSGRDFNDLLSRMPSSERNKVVQALLMMSRNTQPPSGGIVAATEQPQ